MKKILLILLTVVFGLSFTSCEGNGGKATVEVQVIKSNMPQSGMSVYMFDNTRGLVHAVRHAELRCTRQEAQHIGNLMLAEQRNILAH